MRGSIVDAKKAHPDVLHVEIRDSAGELWRLATQDAEWFPADPPELVGQVIEDAEIDESSGELRCPAHGDPVAPGRRPIPLLLLARRIDPGRHRLEYQGLYKCCRRRSSRRQRFDPARQKCCRAGLFTRWVAVAFIRVHNHVKHLPHHRKRWIVRKDLYAMRADGSGHTRLTRSPRMLEEWPSWDPSGERIAFTSYRPAPAGKPFDLPVMQINSVMQINADGTCLTKVLTSRRQSLSGVAWQPGPGRGAGPIECGG